MTDLEAIQARISRRGYTSGVPAADVPFFEDMCRTLSDEYGLYLALGQNAGGAFNGARKSYGMFTGVQSCFLLAGAEGDAHALEKMGHAGERLVLEATKRGLGSCWVGGTFDKSALAQDVPAGYTLRAVITVGGVPAEKTGREKLIYRLAHRGSKTPQQMYTADAQPPDWFLHAMDAVVKAPSAINRQPVLVRYQNGKVTAETTGSGHFEAMDLGIAKLHFELVAGGRFAYGSPGAYAPPAPQQ